MDLLVSYECGHFGRARREIYEALRRCGDERASIERTSVNGIALVRTTLDGRDVVRHCRELFHAHFIFRFAIKWVPVDYWCETDLEALRKLLEGEVRARIPPEASWGMKVEKRRWQQHHTNDIVQYLARAIDRKVDLDHPDNLVRIDVLGDRTAISVLRPGDVFSVTAPGERHAADGDA
jgi:tRNA acetyltransferase TAN1